MSRKPKNNHYHYAERFTDRAKRSSSRPLVLPPKRFLLLIVLLVLTFAVIATTFSASFDDDDKASGGSMIIRMKTARVNGNSAEADSDEGQVVSRVNRDLAETAGMTDLLYNSATKGWGTNSTTSCNSSGWISLRFTADTNNETFKIYHKGWTDAYFSKSSAAVSLNTEYTLNNTGSNPNMTFSFVKNAYYGMKIANPDAYNSMKMTLYRLFDANSVFYIDVSDHWGDDDPEIGGYFCDSTSNTGTWVRATRCADIDNSHLYRLVAPNSNIYSKLVLGRFQNGTTDAQMSFSGTRFYNQSVDILYQASNTKIKLTSYGNGTSDKATVSTSSITHTHTYNAYEYTRATTSSSYSLARTISTNASTACGTGTISLTATDRSASGYEFDGWYRGTTAGVDNATTLVSSNLSCTPTNYSGTSYYYAKYTLSSYTIEYKMDATPATATANTITNPATNSVPTSEDKTYGVDYTISSNTYNRPHYTQVGWATTPNYTSQTSGGGTTYYALGGNYAANANLTLYPVWQLNTPTKSNTSADPIEISGGTMTIGTGSTPVNLNLQVSDLSDDAIRYYSYSWSGNAGTSGATVSVGCDPSDATTFMKFTSDTPGTYTVTVTVKDYSRTGVVNAYDSSITLSTDPRYHKGCAAATTTVAATITVQPDEPDFTITAYNVVDDERDGQTAETAYKILLGNRYYFSAAVDSTYLSSHPTSLYTYTWSTNSDFAQEHIVGTGSSITFTNTVVPNTSPKQYTITLINYDPSNPPTPDPRTLADESHGLEQVILYCRAERNGASKATADAKQLFYFIQPLIKSFNYEPFQKIFKLGDTSVALAAQYNIANNPDYTTKLFFSSDNDTFTKAIESSGFIADFTNAIKRFLYPGGPKYFYLEMKGLNSQGEMITSVSEKIHTTVGTSDSTATRTLYFDNNTTVDLASYLVMCYYIDGDGELCYQVAQDRYKGDANNEGKHFRVMLPEDASAVRFGFLARDIDLVRYYGTPTIESGTITGFSAPIYYGYTNQITLSAATRRITASTSTDVGALKSLTCTGSAY